jgi:choline dehydrogenase-like flavoprotein
MTDRILFEGKRAVGVEWLEGESTIPSKATANKEVLLSAGAIASPQILQRSGVGNAELLKQFDIPLVHDLPGVGENLQDHLEMYLQYECKEPVSSTLPCSGGTSRRLAPSGCLAAPAWARATTSKRAGLSAAARSSRGRTFSTTSCRWRLTTTVRMR